MNTGSEQELFYRLKILQCDEPSSITGRIYPRDAVQAALDAHRLGYGILADQAVEPALELPLHSVSHKVLQIDIDEDGAVWCDIEMLPLLNGGEKVMSLFDHLRLSPVMTGILGENSVVSDITMCYTAWVMKDPTTIEEVIAGEQ